MCAVHAGHTRIPIYRVKPQFNPPAIHPSPTLPNPATPSPYVPRHITETAKCFIEKKREKKKEKNGTSRGVVCGVVAVWWPCGGHVVDRVDE